MRKIKGVEWGGALIAIVLPSSPQYGYLRPRCYLGPRTIIGSRAKTTAVRHIHKCSLGCNWKEIGYLEIFELTRKLSDECFGHLCRCCQSTMISLQPIYIFWGVKFQQSISKLDKHWSFDLFRLQVKNLIGFNSIKFNQRLAVKCIILCREVRELIKTFSKGSDERTFDGL